MIGGSQLHQHILSLDSQWVNRDLGTGIVSNLAAFGIVLPAVPGTNNFSILHHALAQRSTTMQAHIVHSGVLALDIGDANGLFTNCEFPGFAFSRKTGFGDDFR